MRSRWICLAVLLGAAASLGSASPIAVACPSDSVRSADACVCFGGNRWDPVHNLCCSDAGTPGCAVSEYYDCLSNQCVPQHAVQGLARLGIQQRLQRRVPKSAKHHDDSTAANGAEEEEEEEEDHDHDDDDDRNHDDDDDHNHDDDDDETIKNEAINDEIVNTDDEAITDDDIINDTPDASNDTPDTSSDSTQPSTRASKPKVVQKTMQIGGYNVVYYTTATSGTAVTKAVLVLHGVAGDSLSTVQTVAKLFASSSVVVLGPHFYTKDAQFTPSPLPSNPLTFSSANTWISGQSASNDDSIYSYDILDTLAQLTKKSFPNLRTLAFVGHSAGAQVLQRYAGATTIGTSAGLGISVRYIVSSPGTYMYLDTIRPKTTLVSQRPSICPSASNCKIQQADYSSPTSQQISTCPDFNTDKYGLEGDSSDPSYVTRAGAVRVRAQLPKQTITYIYGSKDTTVDSNLDTSCEANMTGKTRLDRGLIWFSYMRQLYPASTSSQSVQEVNCPHSATCVYSSSQFQKALQ
ncbi:uncharacterized protein BJ171DRAFT_566217 [Polychytrium aggregatum]|uniref:uncharacterized protein n=1 Tax=Polychytrium aggregatum TaxID=110093 RepID=UPI0022FEFCD3|nr:uncharacterized protein BJ171DRAFT_566217 [Polychytrium aggregatum]KAI9206830.1 hypothetical protein BJ171DRAFT_566217 [Polychytrium aggregatum]